MKVSKKVKRAVIISAIAGIVVGVLGAFLSVVQSKDFYDCEISSWNIDAKLEENGDLKIVDTIKFNSQGYHFFEYEIGYGKTIIEGTGSNSYLDIGSVKVSAYNNQGHYYFSEASESTSNSSSYFKNSDCLGFSWNSEDCEEGGRKLNYYTNGKQRELIYIYLDDGLDDTINFKYEYTIKNALNKYADLSELNWCFASPLEEMGVKNISLTLSLPELCANYNVASSWEEEGIMVFGHGNGNSEFTQINNTKIEAKATSLREKIDDKFEVRVVVPNSPFDAFSLVSSENTISSSRSGKDILIQEEEKLTEQDKNITNLYNKVCYSFILIHFFSSMILFGLTVFIYLKFDKERKPEFDNEYLREPPSILSPSQLSYLINEQEVTTDAFTGTLISLIRKKYILIDSNGSSLLDDKANYSLTLNKENAGLEQLNDDEKFVLDLLFSKMFNESFTMDEFEKKMKKESSAIKYTESLSLWQKSSRDKAKKLGFYDNVKVVSSFALFGVIGLIYCIYSILLQYLELFLPTWTIILASLTCLFSVFLILYVPTITRKSKKGIEEYTKWMAFKKFLCDFSHFEDYDMMSVIMWEEYLVYASVLGIADLVEKQIRIKLKESGIDQEQVNNLSTMDDLYLILYLNRVSRRMNFYSAMARETIIAAKMERARATAGSIAGSGGFGGSSSHGGGGHGGRAG